MRDREGISMKLANSRDGVTIFAINSVNQTVSKGPSAQFPSLPLSEKR
ncbi:MAG: hypothetical protein J7517_00095 [Sphingobium yanoikuyae]|jgi:hypothetical protein|nr:hypothetical protein [Sphingobium yanoikuyae]MBO9524518.1 hypothetical protein [Sphingobium yanoikuyae]